MNTKFFLNPVHPMQRKYEALRLSIVENLSDRDVAKQFGYTYFGFKTIKRDGRLFQADDFFKDLKKGRPEGFSSKSLSLKERVLELRKKNYSEIEIEEKLKSEATPISILTISALLKTEGFSKLFRRTHVERLEALQSSQEYPEKSDVRAFGSHAEFTTGYGGIFLFIPLLFELNLAELFEQDGLYGSKIIPRQNYMYSYLSLKLLGKERLSHISDLSFDYGLGTFAGLNVLPKSTAISSYSYRHSPELIRTLLRGFMKTLHKKGYIKGNNINLDFHSIPYYGNDPTLEKNWIPTKGKRMKSILSFFAQDLDTTFLMFSDGNIKNTESNDEVLEFVNFYKNNIGLYPECLIFDSKLTTYKNLYKLNELGIKFITLGRRGNNFEKEVYQINDWKTVRLEGVTRLYQNLKYHSRYCTIKDYPEELKEIIVKGNGRELPMRLITNERKENEKAILQKYSRRWRIENNIQENVDFFSLNAVSSPVIVKVDFDIAMTLVANTLYKILAQKMKWLDKAKPKTIARKLLDTKAKISMDADKVIVKYANRAYNPLIREWTNKVSEISVPWWDNRKLFYKFE